MGLRNALPTIDPKDERKIEMVVTNIPFARSLPVAMDATLISPLHADGIIWPKADRTPRVSFDRARKSKLRAYPELENCNVLHLVIATTELGGRMNKEAIELIESATLYKVRNDPIVLRKQAARAWQARRLTLLSVAAQR